MKIAKVCACIAAGLVSTLALADAANVCVLFETTGPDCYADGSQVLNGERYAFVATPKGRTFGGFNLDCTAVVAGDKVLTIAPFAKDGRLPLTLFQADATDLNLDTMDWSVWLLDTRTSKTEVPGFSTKVSELRLNGAVEIKDATMSASVSASALTGDTSMINPTIKDFAVEGGNALITIGNVQPCLAYRVRRGLNREGLTEVPEVTENGDGTVTLKVSIEESDFFSVTAQ